MNNVCALLENKLEIITPAKCLLKFRLLLIMRRFCLRSFNDALKSICVLLFNTALRGASFKV